MIRSMSGHGRAEVSGEAGRVVAEVRSVNHRFCRVAVRVPAILATLEEPLRQRVQKLVARGKVDVTVTHEGSAAVVAQIDVERARQWATRLQDLTAELNMTPPALADVLALPGVVEQQGPVQDDSLSDLAHAAVRDALEQFAAMRDGEGRHLAEDLTGRADAILAGVEQISVVADGLPQVIREQLAARVAELLEQSGVAVDEVRLIQEAAYYAERSDITEELVRLRSHVVKLKDMLGKDEAVGRSLEFVTQEIHRELNTIGSKSRDLGITDVVVELKSELERIREQVQNIE